MPSLAPGGVFAVGMHMVPAHATLAAPQPLSYSFYVYCSRIRISYLYFTAV